MADRRTAPAEVDQRLLELADLFDACRDAFFDTAERFHWVPAPGSGAAAAADALPSPDPAVSGPRGETGHRLIAEVVQTYLLTASGHLGGLAALYARGEVLFSPPVLIRATIENCAHAVWVVGEDSDEPAEDRLARAYLEEFLSADEAKKNAGLMHAKSHASYVRALAYYKALKVEIRERFPSNTELLEGRDSTVNGLQLLGPEATVGRMYALTESYGGTIGGRAAKGIYGFLSNMTHPTLYPARQSRVWIDDPSVGHAVAKLRINLSTTEAAARGALAAFYNALTYVTSYFGWSTETVDRLTSSIEKAIPTFFK